jgi:CRP/FNR family transcriptional regulator, nitrogen oxide reductase regulator
MSIDRSLIADMDPFVGLSGHELDVILQDTHSFRVAKEDAIFEQGDDASRFFLLLDGIVRVVQTSKGGNQVVARFINAGSIIGIAPAIGRTTYPATALAAVDCVVLAWPTENWPDLSTRFPIFAANTYKTIGARLEETQRKVMELSAIQVEKRVASALLGLVKQTGKKTDDGILIDFPISRKNIAEMTGTTLHTVSRLLSGWESRVIIKSSRQKIIVADAHRLVLISQADKTI